MGPACGKPSGRAAVLTRPRREDWERLAALHLIHRLGHGTRHTARLLGFPKSTIHDWLRQGPVGIRDPRLRELGHRIVEQSVRLTASEEEMVVDFLEAALSATTDGAMVLAELFPGRVVKAPRLFYDPSEVRVTSGPTAGEWTSDGGVAGAASTEKEGGRGAQDLAKDSARVIQLVAELRAAKAETPQNKDKVAKLAAALKDARALVRADHAAVRAVRKQTTTNRKAAAAGKRREKELTRSRVPKGKTVKTAPAAAAARKHSEHPDGLVAAGLAVVAVDTGRVLMIQRSLEDPDDPAAGTWEFPGGKLEDGEEPFNGGTREFEEEVGAKLPDGRRAGSWTSPNGVYRGEVWVIPSEEDLDINLDHEDRAVLNPDDPDGDHIEVAAWFDPEDLPSNPALRPECLTTDWDVIEEATVADDGERDHRSDEPAQRGVMVAFFLPPDAAKTLARDAEEDPTALPPEELHLTLAYLGQVDEIENPGRLRRVVAGFAAIAPPVPMMISGTGRFATGDRTVYASVDAPLLPEWRQRLVAHLRAGGYPPNMKHGYTPHVSLCSPDGPVALEVEPVEFDAGTLTLAYGGDHYGWPLEGSAALFAEPRKPRAGSDVPRSEGAEPDEEAEESRREGEERAMKAVQPGASNQRSVTGAGEPGDAEQPTGAETADQQLDLLNPDSIAPPIMDRWALEAWHRYVTALANDVSHTDALRAAQKIDENFTVSEAQARQLIHALGKGNEPVRFGWSAGGVQPPQHVTNVFDSFEFTPEQQQELADYLYQLAQDSYAEGINAQLLQLGQPVVGAITDQSVLAELRTRTDDIAQGIANTYNRDLAAEVYSTWIEHRSAYGRQSSERLLWEDINRWAEARADDRADMVSTTEIGRFYNAGVSDFMTRNEAQGYITVELVDITPDECQCMACLRMIQDGPYTMEEAVQLDVPLHPRCIHLLSPRLVVLSKAEADPTLWWAAQQDEAA